MTSAARHAALAAACGLVLAAVGAHAQAAPARDGRAGLVVTGGPSDGYSRVGTATWYAYGAYPPDPAHGQMRIVRPWEPLAELTQQARTHPGGTYLVGNEANNVDQDGLTGAQYAAWLRQVVDAVRAGDPAATFVGPQTLNWTHSAGYTSGQAWSEAFLSAWTGPLPFAAWSMHTYSLDWTHLPTADPQFAITEMQAARAWLDSRGIALPLWLTEFGIVWAFDQMRWDGQRWQPAGTYRQDLVLAWLDTLLAWLTRQPQPARVERWLAFSSTAITEPWAGAPSGVAYLDANGALTATGQRYRAWAADCGQPVGVDVQPTAGGVVAALRSRGATAPILGVQVGAVTGGTASVAGLTVTVTQTSVGAVTAPLTVTDRCGTPWQTFVGRGTGSGSPVPTLTPPATPRPIPTPPGLVPQHGGRAA